mgnify:CR=1 FL=1
MLFTLFLFSCNETASKKVYKPQSSGNINSLLVVIDDDDVFLTSRRGFFSEIFLEWLTAHERLQKNDSEVDIKQ